MSTEFGTGASKVDFMIVIVLKREGKGKAYGRGRIPAGGRRRRRRQEEARGGRRGGRMDNEDMKEVMEQVQEDV
eukprot:633228-Hanusia_phi.AAC.2